ncbi:glycosyltransferase involved in cell wall biosynthesis [Rhizomicrobium palustre]|uniref:Glycosyltransferase involved in cell wall biosynthesis n=1 Tax=Rhizomicrobium palustre TaxID=189966 RepID=A0A846N2J8_9PROT|nr:glycosyltransferase family 1 protein [Rhizomicrobium palustre]NIK89833.1 glycosyltransferase involved in cell wall biosynthesis [Rhizomicrobium palustre]
MAAPIYFNGKFYAGELNGVHRVADRLVREVDRLAAASDKKLDLRLLIPKRRQFSPQVNVFKVEEQELGHTQRWEQGILPFVAKDGHLINLANLSPIMHRSKVTLIHDAQFYISPGSYATHFSIGYRILTPIMARSSRAVLTVSEFSREMLGAFGVAKWQKTGVLYNGADHILEAAPDVSVLQKNGLEQGGYAVVFGSTFVYKNVATAFAAFADPQLADVKLVVIGPSAEKLRASGLNPPPNAVFVGKLNDGELRALYQSALCLVYPSRTEGFGLPPLEAMLCDCPAIVAPAGAIPEVCRDAALYADVADIAGWVMLVNSLRQDEALRRAKIEQGRKRAATFTWASAGERLMKLVQSLPERLS